MANDKKVIELLEEIRNIQRESFEKNEKYRQLLLRLLIIFTVIVFLPLILDILT